MSKDNLDTDDRQDGLEEAKWPRPKRSRLVDSVFESLEREILYGQFVNRPFLPAETALAAEFGTSRSTIRQAVDLLALEGLVIKRPNSSPAIVQSAARTPMTSSHEVLIWVSHPISDPSTLSFLKGVSRGLLGSNYRMVVREPRRNVGKVVCSDEEQFVRELLARHDWDGAVMWRDAFAHHDDLLRALAEKGRPLIFVDIPPPDGIRADFVGTANASAAQSSTDYLLGLGHSRVVFVADTDVPETTRERIRGYRRAMRHAGIGEMAEVVVASDLNADPGGVWSAQAFPNPADKSSRYFADLANRAVNRILSMQPRPTALFVSHDVFARHICARLEVAGIRVPSSMSVVGFDWLAGIDQSLPDDMTTVAQSFEELGFQSACMFLDRVSGELPTSTRYVLVNAPLVIRSSTAPDLSLPPVEQAAIPQGRVAHRNL